jgi:hypothetical protein
MTDSVKMPRGRPRKKKEDTQPQQPIMTKEQTLLLARAVLAMDRICLSYRRLCHPNIKDVVELDDARFMLREEFAEEIDKEINDD